MLVNRLWKPGSGQQGSTGGSSAPSSDKIHDSHADGGCQGRESRCVSAFMRAFTRASAARMSVTGRATARCRGAEGLEPAPHGVLDDVGDAHVDDGAPLPVLAEHHDVQEALQGPLEQGGALPGARREGGVRQIHPPLPHRGPHHRQRADHEAPPVLRPASPPPADQGPRIWNGNPIRRLNFIEQSDLNLSSASSSCHFRSQRMFTAGHMGGMFCARSTLVV